MDSSLVPVSPSDLVSADAAAINAAIGTQAFLSRIQLMTANSGKCKSGQFSVNHYAMISGQNYIDIGTDVEVLVCSFRPMAMRITPDGVKVVYDPKCGPDGKPTGEFAAIVAESANKDSGCLYGIQFLLWVPSQNQFVTYFLGSPSARREAPSLMARAGFGAILRHQIITTKKYTWAAPLVAACSDLSGPMPDKAAFIDEVERFKNPPAEVVETVVEEDSRER